MNSDYKVLLKSSKEKVISAVHLVEASLNGLAAFQSHKDYSPKELEPYDALTGRFIRSVETSIKYFKTYEYYLNAASSETLRALLLNMQKLNLISSLNIWVDMRDIRNRIANEYLPDQIKAIYDLIMGEYKDELTFIRKKVEAIDI